MKDKCKGSGKFGRTRIRYSYETVSGKQEFTITCPVCKRTFKARGNNLPPHKHERAFTEAIK